VTAAGRRPQERLPCAGTGTFIETFLVFLRLGLTSFGGPIAHIGYFRNEFVQRRAWLDERAFADLVALCQLLPGPASSQLGMAIGFGRAGWAGTAAAWLGFTLPSALALILFALGVANLETLARSGALQGLKVVAVAVVAQAVWGMGRTLCPDLPRALLAAGACLLMIALPFSGLAADAAPAVAQVVVIAGAALLGWHWLRVPAPETSTPARFLISPRAGRLALLLFALLLVGLPLLAWGGDSMLLRLVDGFYRAGALVFGGGHVVLPLLHSAVVPSGVVSDADFVSGYGAAQAVPGPLFTFAAYLGALAAEPAAAGWSAWLPWAGGLLMLVVIFLPGFLLVIGMLPFWTGLRQRPGFRSAIAGINAAVVGILLAALYDPVWTSAIHSPIDAVQALAAFVLLTVVRMHPIFVVALSAAVGLTLAADALP
jgi:chromate transporter